MRSLILIAALAAGLAGCNANINPNVATPNQAYIGENAYVVAVSTGRIYLASPFCTNAPPARLCQEVFTAVRSIRTASKQVFAALKAHQDVPLTALDALRAAYSVIQSIPQK